MKSYTFYTPATIKEENWSRMQTSLSSAEISTTVDSREKETVELLVELHQSNKKNMALT